VILISEMSLSGPIFVLFFLVFSCYRDMGYQVFCQPRMAAREWRPAGGRRPDLPPAIPGPGFRPPPCGGGGSGRARRGARGAAVTPAILRSKIAWGAGPHGAVKLCIHNFTAGAGRAPGIGAESPQDLHKQIRGLGADSPAPALRAGEAPKTGG
jgi:hypothetical protein